MVDPTPDWSTVPDLLDRLTRRWNRGTWLGSYARGDAFEPVRVPARIPSAADLIERTAEVQAWAARFRSDAARRPGLQVENKTLRGRSVGANDVPAAIRFDSFTDLVTALAVEAKVASFDSAAAITEALLPEAHDWVREHPLKVVASAPVWPQLLAALRWVLDHDLTELDLRHIDAPGVDSKFLVEHRNIVRPLLDELLPDERVHTEFNDLDKRYGFRSRPSYVRLRTLGNDLGIAPYFSELDVRVDELAAFPLPIADVYVVENRATFNAFPDRADSIVVFGGGYAVTSLAPIDWLLERRLIYWGDIDTHGFRILSRLRGLFPHCISMLMDEETLEANLERVVSEPSPLTEHLEHLSPVETRLYRDLREDRYAKAIRLEQERIPLGALLAQLDSTLMG
jgi:hypothetical protein